MVMVVKQLGDEPIIVITVTPPFDSYKDVIQKLEAIEAIANTIDSPIIYRINDYSAVTQASLDDIMTVLARETRSGSAGSLADPRVRSVAVGSDEMIRLAATSLKQTQYGNLDVPLFESYDDALAYIREDMARRIE
ncbi:MAG: hypothetical protein JW966_03085 [Anaerolineae bacterium]|nr:hypothetical protein [Anaerolineae bacterium]